MAAKKSKFTRDELNARRERMEWVLAHQNIKERDWAEAAGLSSAHVGAVKRGTINDPGTEVFTRIAQAYNLNPRYISHGELPRYLPTAEHTSDQFPCRIPFIEAAKRLPYADGASIIADLMADSNHEADPGEVYWGTAFLVAIQKHPHA